MQVRGYYKGEVLFLTEAKLEVIFGVVIHIREMARSIGLSITLAVEDEDGVTHIITGDDNEEANMDDGAVGSDRPRRDNRQMRPEQNDGSTVVHLLR